MLAVKLLQQMLQLGGDVGYHRLTCIHHRFTALFQGPPGEPAPAENFWTFVSDIAIFVLKRDVKLQLTSGLYGVREG